MRLLGAVLALLLGGPAVAQSAMAEEANCPPVKLAPLALPRVNRALEQREEVVIVAIGSSSTAGSRASDMAHTYPAVLQVELERLLPGAHIAVINRGIGGQDAAEMVPRLEHDAVATVPTLVIWQLGANGAMRGNDPHEFQRLVTTGVKRLGGGGADVVLMDNQRSPRVLASPLHAKIDQALADVAGREHAKLFGRGRLMDLWQEAGFPYAEFIDADEVHHNDRGYACVAKALAAAIVAGLSPESVRLHASK